MAGINSTSHSRMNADAKCAIGESRITVGEWPVSEGIPAS
jgi:hypothetical protein